MSTLSYHIIFIVTFYHFVHMCIAFPSPTALCHIYVLLYSHREIASWLMFLFVLLYRYEINILLFYYYYNIEQITTIVILPWSDKTMLR